MITGQKVWNSAADVSRRGLLLARTDPDVPKREGITFFVIDMDQPGIDARPLRQMNGDAHFCEVFLTDARVRAADVIGGVHHGWHVARTTLTLERAGAADGGARGLVVVASGEKSGQLDRLIGDVIAPGAGTAKPFRRSVIRSRDMIQLARERGATGDPHVRQNLAR